jgi:hypothetical protein
VNRVLGFGTRGITASDIALSPKLLLMLIYENSMPSAFSRGPDSVTHDSGCIDCAAHDEVMSAGKNIRSAHNEVEKTLVDGRNLKRAKERNKYLTPGDPQSRPRVEHRTWQTPSSSGR